jgi:hypothetical protein
MAAHLSQTGVGENRCSWRAICNVAIMRPFNQHALEKAKANKATAAEKEKVKRVKGRQLLEYLSEYATNFLDECDAAQSEFDETKTKRIKSELRSKENKASTVQNNAAIQKINNTINARRKTPKGMTKTGIDVPAGVGGAVMMKYIAYTHMDGKENANKILRAELKVRKIEFTDKQWDAMDWNTKKYQLKLAESKLRIDAKKGEQGINANKLSEVVPQSAELKRFLMIQKDIHRKDKQNDRIETESYA